MDYTTFKPRTKKENVMHATESDNGSDKFYNNKTIDIIRELPLVDVIEKHLTLVKRGSILKCLCPFHTEKTPSFTVYSSSNTYKCFGCGEGGDGIGFIMKYKGLPFLESCKFIAAEHGIEWKEAPRTAEELKLKEKEDELFLLNQKALEFFKAELENSKEAKHYLENERSFKQETINEFDLGWAPGKNKLKAELEAQGYTSRQLCEAGLVSYNKEKDEYYDYFRERIIFPFTTTTGRIAGFSGRKINNNNPKNPKYFNTAENAIFKKRKLLFGLTAAQSDIRRTNKVVIVEGPTDVLTAYQSGTSNVVATNGTAITREHCLVLKKRCSDIILMLDNDSSKERNSGLEAMIKSAPDILKEGLNLFVYPLPEDTDPDNYFKNSEYDENKEEVFITWYANRELSLKNNMNAVVKANKQQEIANLLELIETGIADNILTELENSRGIGKTKSESKNQSESIKKLLKDARSAKINKIEGSEFFPKYVNYAEAVKYGFWETIDDPDYNHKYPPHQYIMNNEPITTFVLKPLGFIDDPDPLAETYRNFLAKSTFGEQPDMYIQITPADYSSTRTFRVFMENKGKFMLKEGCNESALRRLVNYWTEKSDYYKKIKYLGWQPEGFWAWANGISTPTDEFIPIDNYGYVEFKGMNYFIEPLSQYHRGKIAFDEEKRFIYTKQENIELKLFWDNYRKLLGDQVLLNFCFYITAIFQDVVFGLTGSVPELNIYGPKNTGKNKNASLLLSLFGIPQTPVNLYSDSIPAITKASEFFLNGITVIDEYKNEYAVDKIEILKAGYNKTSRKRLYDRKTSDNVPVNSMMVIMGQEIITADPALTRRQIFTAYGPRKLTMEEQDMFSTTWVPKIEKGCSHITAQLLKYRKKFEENFKQSKQAATREIEKLIEEIPVNQNREELQKSAIKDNYSTIIASFDCIREFIDVSFTIDEVYRIAIKRMQEHIKIMVEQNEKADFWNVIEFLSSELIQQEDRVVRGLDYGIYWNSEKEIYELRLALGKVKRKVNKNNRKEGLKSVFDEATLKNYLEQDGSFLEYKNSHVISSNKVTTSAHVFDYYKLCKEHSLNLHKQYPYIIAPGTSLFDHEPDLINKWLEKKMEASGNIE